MNPKIIVALDFPNATSALELAQKLDPVTCRVKVGKELFTRSGPDLIEQLHKLGFAVFLDLKYHDIPNTVAAACRAAAELGVWMLNVHALGGKRMLEAAKNAVATTTQPPLLIGVTVLTSHTDAELAELGITLSAQQLTLKLAQLTQQAGLDGVVCSAQEAQLLRERCGAAFKLVTPGIRLQTDTVEDDQRRIMTPHRAIQAGADYLVIGRPVTQAVDPAVVINNINHHLQAE